MKLRGLRILELSVAAVLGLGSASASAQPSDTAELVAAPLERAQGFLAKGDSGRAYRILDELVQDGTSEPTAYLYLGVLDRSAGRHTRAIAIFERGLEVSPDHVELQLELAMTYAWEGRLDDALRVYDGLVREHPSVRAARTARARVLAWAGRHGDATAEYDALLKEDPEDVEALRGAAFVHRSRMRYRRAKRNYRRVLALQPDDPEALEGLAEIESATRWTADAAVGLIYFPGIYAARADGGLAARINPDTEVRARYSADVPTGLGASAGDAQTRIAHTPEVGLVQRASKRLTLDLAYQARMQRPSVAHRLALRGAVEASSAFVLHAGVRPGLRHDLQREVLADVGLQWIPLERLWLMGQAFYYTNDQRQQSWTAVATAWARPARVFSFRVGAGVGEISDALAFTAFAMPTLHLGDRWECSVGYEYLRGFVTRHAGTVRATVRF